MRVGCGLVGRNVAGCCGAAWRLAQGRAVVNLPSSKELGAVPGNPQRVNSEPMSMAVSPDGRYVVTVNAGYGTFESEYEQSLAVMDTQTGKVADFPDARTETTSKQTLYSGLAFSGDGKHVYASMASLTDPAGRAEREMSDEARRSGGDLRIRGKANTGNGIAVYGFSEGKITPERVIPIGLQKLAGGAEDGVDWRGGRDAGGAVSGGDCGGGTHSPWHDKAADGDAGQGPEYRAVPSGCWWRTICPTMCC